MDAKPHYFKIGLFVLLAAALIVAAVVIFGSGLLAQDELFFESYFAASITGLMTPKEALDDAVKKANEALAAGRE
mgnify:CR=1 FL=1